MTGALTAVKIISVHLSPLSIFAGDRSVEICWNPGAPDTAKTTKRLKKTRSTSIPAAWL
jgi:hypothetical protein